MRIISYPKKEKNAKAWIFRLFLGPASLIDGTFETLTFSFFGIGLRLYFSKKLAMARNKP